jgi:hypothetical protein
MSSLERGIDEEPVPSDQLLFLRPFCSGPYVNQVVCGGYAMTEEELLTVSFNGLRRTAPAARRTKQ